MSSLFFWLADAVAWLYARWCGARLRMMFKCNGVLVKVYLADRLFPAWANGITIGRNVFLLSDVEPDMEVGMELPVLKHELWHVMQGKRWGILFPLLYLLGSIGGYRRNPFEREAYAKQHRCPCKGGCA